MRLFGNLILELMGWMGEHLNQFRKGDSYYAPAYQREGEIPPLYGRIENHNQEDFALGDVLREKDDTMVWEYDFGDSWNMMYGWFSGMNIPKANLGRLCS